MKLKTSIAGMDACCKARDECRRQGRVGNSSKPAVPKMELPGVDKAVMTTRMSARRNALSRIVLGALRALMMMMWFVSFAVAQLSSQPTIPLTAPAKPVPALTVPLPPVRPAGVPAVVSPSPPPQAPATSALPVEAVPTPSVDPPSQPQILPPASRARMHECGVEWQKMKASGAAADKIWFDFAKVCLTR